MAPKPSPDAAGRGAAAGVFGTAVTFAAAARWGVTGAAGAIGAAAGGTMIGAGRGRLASANNASS